MHNNQLCIYNHHTIMINLNLGALKYDDDEEYRAILCEVFDVPDFESPEADDFSFDARFEYIYAQTKDNSFFLDSYRTAAGFMISEDVLTGICILCAYDYLAVFYATYVSYINEGRPVTFSPATSQAAQNLLDKITRK